MAQEKTYDLNETHKYFAQSTNSRVWELLKKLNQSEAENDEMLHAAHASAYHWTSVGTPLHQQRGEWLISHVHVALGHGNEALRHAQRCFVLTESNRDLMQDFDIAYAFEGMARRRCSEITRWQKDFLSLLNRRGTSLPTRKSVRSSWLAMTVGSGMDCGNVSS